MALTHPAPRLYDKSTILDRDALAARIHASLDREERAEMLESPGLGIAYEHLPADYRETLGRIADDVAELLGVRTATVPAPQRREVHLVGGPLAGRFELRHPLPTLMPAVRNVAGRNGFALLDNWEGEQGDTPIPSHVGRYVRRPDVEGAAIGYDWQPGVLGADNRGAAAGEQVEDAPPAVFP